MEDNKIPKDAVFFEAQTESAAFYGTSSPKKAKNNHTGLIVVLSLLVILLCSTQMLVLILGIRLVRTPEGWRLTTGRTETEQSARQTVLGLDESVWRENSGAPLVRLVPEREARGADEIYEQVADSVICLTVERMDEATVYTGVLLTENGYAVTCCGEAEEALSIDCCMADGSFCGAEFLGTDPVTGVSLLQLAGDGFTAAVFGAAEETTVGQSVYAVGNPNGALLRNVLCEGTVTAVGRQTELDGTKVTLLQTSAVFESGGSGSPIFDESGRVIALTAELPGHQTDTGVAVAAEDLQGAIERILQQNAAADLDLGFDVGQIPALCVAYYRFPGRLWIRQICDPQLERAGLYARDVIVEADGRQVATWEEFQKILAAHEAGERIELLIYRDGVYYEARLTVQKR